LVETKSYYSSYNFTGAYYETIVEVSGCSNQNITYAGPFLPDLSAMFNKDGRHLVGEIATFFTGPGDPDRCEIMVDTDINNQEMLDFEIVPG
jgi:hypothetical protein